jgi:hypothetical protein
VPIGCRRVVNANRPCWFTCPQAASAIPLSASAPAVSPLASCCATSAQSIVAFLHVSHFRDAICHSGSR